MEIILVSNSRNRRAPVQLGSVATTCIFLLALTAAGGMMYTGYRLGLPPEPVGPSPEAQRIAELEHQREAAEVALHDAHQGLDALALRVGELKARVIRLDALGSRLVEMANLDRDEFNFSVPPPRGGPMTSQRPAIQAMPDFLEELESLSRLIEDRTPKLGVLQGVLVDRNLRSQLEPAGRPIAQGWLSSHFGKRIDPISGKVSFHEGIDFAGKPGTDVLAVAGGIVTASRRHPLSGYMVEVNHGGGFVTRYGHNQENLVEVGDTVKKWQPIALMGSTGRSTGTHVHFELHKDGRPINPLKYVQTVR